MISLDTPCGKINGLQNNNCNIFLNIPYAKANRFEYSTIVTSWNGILDGTKPGNACPQERAYNAHLEHPRRRFFYREFRENDVFTYDEDCLNLNIYTPSTPGNYPVIIYIHGGGFDSGSNTENEYNPENLARKGIVVVVINYRVGILGYITHKELQQKNGRDGNFGLDDQVNAIKWVKNNISAFYGDSENITLMGQSAGAISIQYLCLNHQLKGLFSKAFMMSGAGRFPTFAGARPPEDSHPYWEEFMKQLGVSTIEELQQIDINRLFLALEVFRQSQSNNVYNTMPVVDGVLIPESTKKLFKNPLKLDYMIGYTNNDMFAPALAFIGHKIARKTKAFVYYFDIDAKGDNEKAFHSSDVRFVFNTLKKSWRPYDEDDEYISELMMTYIKNFVYTGNPNTRPQNATENEKKMELPKWKPAGFKALHLREGKKINMTFPHFITLLINMLSSGSQI